MDVELTAGFAAVIASLLAIVLLVIASQKIIEKTHRKSLESQQKADPDSADDGNSGHAR